MLNVDLFDSDINNKWLIRQFEAYRYSGSSLTDKFIPRSYISVVFHFKDRPFIQQEQPILLEPFFVAPIIPKTIELTFHGNMDTFVAHCKPTAFSRIFNVNLSPVAKRSINLPPHFFYPLWKSLAGLRTTNARMNCFMDFIGSIQKTAYIPDAIDILYDKIIDRGITTLLKELIAECPASKSTLFRKFVQRTGVSPKTLMRIVRLDYLWTKIRNEKVINYQHMVFDGNYFDQSHFINDFKTIIGETPSYFFKRNLDIVKMFSGIAIERNAADSN